jgi:hypothetical protein
VGNLGQAARIQRLRPARFQTAVELGDCCLDFADTVFSEGETSFRIIKKMFVLPGVGSLGALALSSEGMLTFILSALAREQSSHTLSGQIVASSAALASCSISDLDHLADGQLFRAIEQQARSSQYTAVELRSRCSQALEHRRINFLIAMDECSDTLSNSLRFLHEVTPIRIRLIEISRFSDDSDTHVIVPRIIMEGLTSEQTSPESANRVPRDTPPPPPSRYTRAARVTTTDETPPSPPPSPADDASESDGATHRVHQRTLAALAALLERKPEQLRVFEDGRCACLARDGWPRHLHYAFVEDNGTNALAINLENDFVRPLANVLIPLTEELSDIFPAATVVWDPTWSKNRGRLEVRPNDVDPATLAQAMLTLIERSAPQLDAALNSLRKPAWARRERN